jgi:hypothetical protein
MLTIKNIDKIVGERIVNEWYIKTILPTTIMYNLNGKVSNQYKIVIQNKISLSEGKIYLSRDFANGKYKRWYELSTTKGGKRSVQLITKDTIKDIKELLEHIKIVALD